MGIVSRRRKRFLLNEAELVDAALALGVEVQLLPFEAMTLYEQLAALRSTTILVGVHGSGLNNAIFMPEGACLIQLLPFGLKYKGSFQANAVAAGVEYREWKLEDSSLSRFHWEFLGEKELRHGKQAVLDRGSPSGGAEVYTFWINQDIVVPVADFVALLEDAILTSPLNRKLYDGAVVEGRNKQEAAARGPRGGDAPRARAPQPPPPPPRAVPGLRRGAAPAP